jgi:hypothetical protein
VKKIIPLLGLSVLIIQLFVMPAVAHADGFSASVTTLPATDVGVTSARLNGSINAIMIGAGADQNLRNVLDDGSTTYAAYFTYGTAPGVYTNTTPSTTYSATNTNFASDVIGLMPCTQYYARAIVLFTIEFRGYDHESNDSLIAFLSGNYGSAGMLGLGVGWRLPFIHMHPAGNVHFLGTGDEITFTTTGCRVKVPGQGATGGSTSSVTSQNPAQMANIIVQSAAIATPKVAPGEKVDITASVANRGDSNGSTKVTLYVNGQEVESQGITLSSGQTAPLHFYVSRNEPGTYSVYVSGVSAGNFTVDLFTNNDILIYGVIALLTLGIAGVLYLVTRRRTT